MMDIPFIEKSMSTILIHRDSQTTLACAYNGMYKPLHFQKSFAYDSDLTSTSAFGGHCFIFFQFYLKFITCKLMGDGQSEVITRTLEMYLCCFTSSNPMEWLKWFTWVECCYNTLAFHYSKYSF